MKFYNAQPAAVNALNNPDPAWAWEQFRFGSDLHRAGEPISACTSAEQRRGWRVADQRELDAHCGIVGGINMFTGEVR